MRGMVQGLRPLLAFFRALGVVLGLAAFCGKAEIAFQQFSLRLTNVTGSRSQARLLSGPDGTLYGTTFEGGLFGRGTIFKIKEDGSAFENLYDFRPTGGDGAGPYGDLVFGRDGALYGTTEDGGTNGFGTMFKIKTDGTGYRVLFIYLAVRDPEVISRKVMTAHSTEQLNLAGWARPLEGRSTKSIRTARASWCFIGYDRNQTTVTTPTRA